MTIRFIEMFGGIGGFRLGLEKLGWKCEWYNDIDKHAVKVYNHNFGEKWKPKDIKEVEPDEIPDFDVLTAGFPCQSFSILGKQLGFKDTRGTLFFDILRVLEAKKPKAFLLENVEGLTRMEEFWVILSLLGKIVNNQKKLLETKNCLNYWVWWKVLNAKNFGIPQNRPRVFIVGFKSKTNFSFPKPSGKKKTLKNILEKNPDPKLFCNKKQIERAKKFRHIRTPKQIARCILASYGRYGKNSTVVKTEKGIRFLSVREVARVQSFPDWFEFPVSKTQAYKLLGNAVPPKMVEAIGKEMEKAMSKKETHKLKPLNLFC